MAPRGGCSYRSCRRSNTRCRPAIGKHRMASFADLSSNCSSIAEMWSVGGGPVVQQAQLIPLGSTQFRIEIRAELNSVLYQFTLEFVGLKDVAVELVACYVAAWPLPRLDFHQLAVDSLPGHTSA
jgi:hypothetical protein